MANLTNLSKSSDVSLTTVSKHGASVNIGYPIGLLLVLTYAASPVLLTNTSKSNAVTLTNQTKN